MTRPRVRNVIDSGPCSMLAAGHVDVLRLQRARHVVDRQPFCARRRSPVDPDVDLAVAAADDHGTWPTPSALSSRRRSTLSAILGDVADRLVAP